MLSVTGGEIEFAVADLNDPKGVDRGALLRRFMHEVRKRGPYLVDARCQSGVYLPNGWRVYPDMGSFIEIATAEAASPVDTVRQFKACESYMARLAARLGEKIVVLRTNCDYSNGHTWASHESYLHRCPPSRLPTNLIPHLVSRVCFCGAGGFNPLLRGALVFSLSPRVAHLRRVMSRESTFDRGIFHTKQEPLCTGYERLHVLAGESQYSEAGLLLRVSSTALVVAMCDAGLDPGNGAQLRDPVAAMHAFSGDVYAREAVELLKGGSATAIEIQAHYLEQAERCVSKGMMPEWAPEALRLWKSILERLAAGAPYSVSGTLDCYVKYTVFADYVAQTAQLSLGDFPIFADVVARISAALEAAKCEGDRRLDFLLGSQSPIGKDMRVLGGNLAAHKLGWAEFGRYLRLCESKDLLQLDLKFGEVGGQGIFAALDADGVLDHHVAGIAGFEAALDRPPVGTRAKLRGEMVRQLANSNGRYLCDWQAIYDMVHPGRSLDLSDPFETQLKWVEPTSAEEPDRFGMDSLLDLFR
jgi:hypothetical protein